MELKLNLKFEKEDLDDLMCTIVESGYSSIGYWGLLDNTTYAYEQDKPDSEIASDLLWEHRVVIIINKEDGIRYVLSIEMLMRGLEVFLQEQINNGRLTIGIDHGRIDMEDIDAPMSDAILQYALFGDIIYG